MKCKLWSVKVQQHKVGGKAPYRWTHTKRAFHVKVSERQFMWYSDGLEPYLLIPEDKSNKNKWKLFLENEIHLEVVRNQTQIKLLLI